MGLGLVALVSNARERGRHGTSLPPLVSLVSNTRERGEEGVQRGNDPNCSVRELAA